MLIVLLFFSLFRTLQGVPMASPSSETDYFSIRLRETESHFGQRTVNDIIISCFATIFACTWSAIHPNIPALTDCWWTRFKRQVTIMICALLAPELITMWALMQRVGAREIMETYNREILKDFTSQPTSIIDSIKGLFHDSPPLDSSKSSIKGPRWTLTHGFFLQMGGFMLSEDGRPIHILIDGSQPTMPQKLHLLHNIKEGIISPPRITEEDIQDRSKGDIISKTLIILQTTWFIVQCIARWSQQLPVTELEIVTLGFAMLNGITYAFWWNKPQNVGRPVFLERENLICTPSKIPEAIDQSTTSTTGENVVASSHEPKTPSQLHSGFLERKLRKSPNAFGIFWYLLQWLVRPLLKLLLRRVTLTHTDAAPVFYKPAINNERGPAAIIAIIGTLFGVVHLIPGWFLVFASRQEMWLWRVSAILITATSIVFGLAVLKNTDRDAEDFFKIIIYLTVLSLLIFYPIARIILLFLSLTSLRTLSPAALQTIEWTTFIPHL
ncbi:hypothetical protein BDN70DRAFT_885346 [Pholiota conissans]|uniref:Uncharacterized protein n=1 Tax=Pholiota conissans TaxID=109636 RepID=A0A9P5YRT7_9AGAR|nr:hypothetical protein BDN70DRAFT_885346 [Pholiota conissans]